jgi:hypothetical protein
MALFIKVTNYSDQSMLVNLDRINYIHKDTKSTYGGNCFDYGAGIIYVKEDFVSNPELLVNNIV